MDQILEKGKLNIFYYFAPSFNPADFNKYESCELENKFYEDQINQRLMFVSEEIDEECEEDRSLCIARLQDAESSFQMEMSFIFDKNEEVNSNQDNIREVSESALNPSVSRSELIRQTKSINSMVSQVDFCRIDSTPVREVKLCTETALVEVERRVELKYHHLSSTGIFKNLCHNYYLSYKEKYTEQA